MSPSCQLQVQATRILLSRTKSGCCCQADPAPPYRGTPQHSIAVVEAGVWAAQSLRMRTMAMHGQEPTEPSAYLRQACWAKVLSLATALSTSTRRGTTIPVTLSPKRRVRRSQPSQSPSKPSCEDLGTRTERGASGTLEHFCSNLGDLRMAIPLATNLAASRSPGFMSYSAMFCRC